MSIVPPAVNPTIQRTSRHQQTGHSQQSLSGAREVIPAKSSPEELATLTRADADKWGKIIKQLGITPQ